MADIKPAEISAIIRNNSWATSPSLDEVELCREWDFRVLVLNVQYGE